MRRPDAVVLERDDATWRVSLTNEQAWPIESTFHSFASEPEPIGYVLLNLRRAEKALHSLAKYPD